MSIVSLLRVENISKVFGSDPQAALPLVREGKSRQEIQDAVGQTVGIAEVSFEVEEGEILVIMGLSGSGKSTVVRCINRLIDPTDGKIWLDDEEITAIDHARLLQIRRHKLGMVFQKFALFPHRSVLTNTEYGLEVMGTEPTERRKKAMEALDLVGLNGWENHFPHELSGGMQQRVGLARALAVDPEIILMDEALSALDPLIRKDMQNELIDLQRKLKKTILFITHDLDEAINIGDRIILMKDGRIVQVGTAEEILANPASHYVERFVEDVDRAKLLTANSIMDKQHDVVHANDGPRAALRKIKESPWSSLFVVDSHGVLQGIVTAEDASVQVKKVPEGEKAKVEYDENVRRIDEDTSAQEMLSLMAESREPLAVVDKNQKLVGMVNLGDLLGGITQ